MFFKVCKKLIKYFIDNFTIASCPDYFKGATINVYVALQFIATGVLSLQIVF